jgi:hypothetical protein
MNKISFIGFSGTNCELIGRYYSNYLFHFNAHFDL